MTRPLPAGIWTLHGDGMVVGVQGAKDLTARWDIVWRPAGGAPEVVLATFRHTYVVDMNAPFDAIKYLDAAQGPAANVGPQDELVLRWTNERADQNAFFEPDGDGFFRNGDLPHIELPQ